MIHVSDVAKPVVKLFSYASHTRLQESKLLTVHYTGSQEILHYIKSVELNQPTETIAYTCKLLLFTSIALNPGSLPEGSCISEANLNILSYPKWLGLTPFHILRELFRYVKYCNLQQWYNVMHVHITLVLIISLVALSPLASLLSTLNLFSNNRITQSCVLYMHR